MGKTTVEGKENNPDATHRPGVLQEIFETTLPDMIILTRDTANLMFQERHLGHQTLLAGFARL